MINGRIHRAEFGAPPTALETPDTTAPLLRYLNPGLDDVQDSEVIAAAKLMHWTVNHQSARLAQVQQMVATYRIFMQRADQRVGIHGRSAQQCCIIADILHHGRGGSTTWPRIDAALRRADPFAALLTIGLPKWKERLKTLRRTLVNRPQFAALHWDRQRADFV